MTSSQEARSMSMRQCVTGTLLRSVVVLAALAAGCDSQTPQSLVGLPDHSLSLQAPRPPVTPAAKYVRPGLEGQWEVGGYRYWRYIVIHHSATARGNAAVFDKSHRRRGYDELGYHFVIDNGAGGPDGNVEVG
ncbi:MAG: hypothetical protein KAU28_09835, partial [Phycisphaerae bacterium]|nr:hypothetical protein [Phycisphaerae bacterium]